MVTDKKTKNEIKPLSYGPLPKCGVSIQEIYSWHKIGQLREIVNEL